MKTIEEKIKQSSQENLDLAIKCIEALKELTSNPTPEMFEKIKKLNAECGKKTEYHNKLKKEKQFVDDLKNLMDSIPTFGVDLGVVGGDKTYEVPFCRQSLFMPKKSEKIIPTDSEAFNVMKKQVSEFESNKNPIEVTIVGTMKCKELPHLDIHEALKKLGIDVMYQIIN